MYLETLSPMTICHSNVLDSISGNVRDFTGGRARFINVATYIVQHEFIRCIDPLVKYSSHAMTLLTIVEEEDAVIEIRRRRPTINIFYRDAVILRDRYPNSVPIQTMIAPSLQLVTREQVAIWVGYYLYQRAKSWVTEEAIDYLFPLVQMVDMYEDEDDTLFRMFDSFPAFEEIMPRSQKLYHQHYRAFSFLTKIFHYVVQEDPSPITGADQYMHLSEENIAYIRTHVQSFKLANVGSSVYTKLLVETVVQTQPPLQRMVETLSLVVP
jgi:hypothetical protein